MPRIRSPERKNAASQAPPAAKRRRRTTAASTSLAGPQYTIRPRRRGPPRSAPAETSRGAITAPRASDRRRGAAREKSVPADRPDNRGSSPLRAPKFARDRTRRADKTKKRARPRGPRPGKLGLLGGARRRRRKGGLRVALVDPSPPPAEPPRRAVRRSPPMFLSWRRLIELVDCCCDVEAWFALAPLSSSAV